ncbi:MAG: hypothetical protein M3Y08_10650, partial [Fibrobacterota bacterium]|nr:hypothetical protein [Fibrobacterota bacterium]
VNASPFRNRDGSMTDEGREGEKVFNREDVGCVRCHVPPGYTDSRLTSAGAGTNASAAGKFFTAEGYRLHDVGTLKPSSGKRVNDSLPGLDTPTLKGIWEMPPYLHDGSAATLEDVLTSANPEDKHGRTSHLTATERSTLVAFLRQLDDGAPGTGISPRTTQGTSLHFTVSPLPGAGGFGLRLEWPAAKSFPRIAVHDPSGKAVLAWPEADLRAAASRPGLLTLVWNGRNGSGRTAPGLYYVQACLDEDCLSRKLMFFY